MLFAGLCLGALIARPESPAGAAEAQPTDLGPILAYLAAAAPRWGVSITGIAVDDLVGGQHWAANGDQELSFMSSAKFPWATMAAAQAGVAATAPYAYPTFSYSDNYAAGSLIDLAGGIDGLNENWYPALGMNNTCTQSWSYGAPRRYSGDCGYPTDARFDLAAGHTFYNHSTADDMNTFLRRLWEGTIPGLTSSEREAVLEWSTLSVDEWAPDGDGTITGYLPPATWPNVHHKIGWYFSPYLSASDVGIVDLDSTTYAISIAAYGGSSSAAQADFMAWASCEVYRNLSGDLNWNCATRAYDAGAGGLSLSVQTQTADGTSAAVYDATSPPARVTATDPLVRITLSATGSAVGGVKVASGDTDCNRAVGAVRPGQPVSFDCRISVGNDGATSSNWQATGWSSGSAVTAKPVVGVFEVIGSYQATWEVQSVANGPWTTTAGTLAGADRAPRWRLTIVNTGGRVLHLRAAFNPVGLNNLTCSDDLSGRSVAFELTPRDGRQVLCSATMTGVTAALGGLVTATEVSGDVAMTALVVTGIGDSVAAGTPLPASTQPAMNGLLYLGAGPARILDTRTPAGGSAPIAAAGEVVVSVPAQALPAGVGANAVRAVAITVTATGAQADGYFTVFETGAAKPLASNVNYTAGEVAPNTSLVATDASGRFTVFTSAAADVVIDLSGVFVDPAVTPGGLGYHGLTLPQRLLDTRATGRPAPDGAGLATNTMPVAGVGRALPASAKAVVVSIAATGSHASGWVSAHPEPVWTGSSSVNFASGDTRANTTIVPVAQDGSIRLTTSTSVDVVADVVGYFDSAADGARYVALSAYRVVDTRWFGERELLPGETRTAQVVGNSSSSPTALLAGFGSSMRSVWLNSTVTRPSGPGWLTLWAGGSIVRPGTSSQNFGTGQTRANGFPVPVSVAGGTANSVDTITVSSGAGAATDWIVDVAGVFVAPSGSTPS